MCEQIALSMRMSSTEPRPPQTLGSSCLRVWASWLSSGAGPEGGAVSTVASAVLALGGGAVPPGT